MAYYRCVPLIMLVMFYMVRADPDTSELEYHCNNAVYDPNSGYRASVDDTLRDVVANTADKAYDYYTSHPAPDNQIVYGHGACNGALSHVDCQACVSYAFPKLINHCAYSVGAQIKVKDCRMSQFISQFSHPTLTQPLHTPTFVQVQASLELSGGVGLL
ncbi:hypothetical protein CRG98_000707 [Punica granatum]|uniref:Gnk2-homologous domain-containing protein n=1 Tax=Punica granatum TaxID=22663 RepID=A0A2I0LDZ7_PUNGR|nr:hypothetical protein CRG98_000707 [Punica granatum]